MCAAANWPARPSPAATTGCSAAAPVSTRPVNNFALSTKLISITVLNVLVGVCAAALVRKTVGILRLYEYRHILKDFKKLIPSFKKKMTRREFISLQMFTYKNA